MKKLARLDPRDSLGISKNGIYERRETDFVRRHLKPGMTFVDCGAHIGYYTAMAADLVGPTGRVYAFEPSPDNFVLLQENTAGHGDRVFTYPFALGDSCGRELLYISPGNSGDNRVSPTDGWFSVEVVKTTLDHVLGETAIDFIKIDVQGGETAVLRGAVEAIGRSKRIAGIVEYAPAHLELCGTSGEELLKTLAGLGFSVSIWRKGKMVRAEKKVLPSVGKFVNMYIERRAA